MPNIKISQLPYTGAPEESALIPIVQFGMTYSTDLLQVIDNLIVPYLGNVYEVLSAKTQNLNVDGTSTIKYPSAAAVKSYADSLVVGLLDDRGNYTPGVVSPGAYPTTGGSGTAGAVLKGDLWFIAANGYLGTTAVVSGQSVRALVNTPGQTTANWDILDVAGFINPPETTDNKVLSEAEFIANGTSIVKYPSVLAVKDYIDNQVAGVTLQAVLNNNHDLVNEVNLQGTNAGSGMSGTVGYINAFGSFAASNNLKNNINAFGTNAASFNEGDNVNAMGLNAANTNYGNNVNAFGTDAAFENHGSYVNAIGYAAAQDNQSSDVNAFGNSAARDNEAQYVNAIGNQAAKGNKKYHVNGIGQFTAYNNEGEYVNAIGYNAGNANAFSNVTLLGQNTTADSANQLVFTKDGTNNMRLDANGINADRKLTMPDADGTVVISVNGTPPNPQGDVTLSIPTPTPGLPYLCYAALLQVSRSPFVIVNATQLYNTIGNGSGDGINDIAWSENSNFLFATMSSAPFNLKTVVMSGTFSTGGTVYSLNGSLETNYQMGIYISNILSSSYDLPNFSNVYVEIRIYP